MSSAIWSASLDQMLDFPAETFVKFYQHHGLLTLNRPQWQYIPGGSHSYVLAFQKQFSGEIELTAKIASIRRYTSGVTIHMENGQQRKFDKVVLAAHADESLKLLEDRTAEEQRLLGAWQYQSNSTILHRNNKFMPSLKRAHASWNYQRVSGAGLNDNLCCTYYMNRLQRLKAKHDYFVTLNPPQSLAAEDVIAQMNYSHPLFSLEALRSQAFLPSLNGVCHTYFCGSYFGYGFHEDAVESALSVVNLL